MKDKGVGKAFGLRKQHVGSPRGSFFFFFTIFNRGHVFLDFEKERERNIDVREKYWLSPVCTPTRD